MTIPEQPGSFRRFGQLVGPRNITVFNSRFCNLKSAHVFIGFEVSNRGDASAMARRFEANRLASLDLTDDELAKLHCRHLVGGKSTFAGDEP